MNYHDREFSLHTYLWTPSKLCDGELSHPNVKTKTHPISTYVFYSEDNIVWSVRCFSIEQNLSSWFA